MAVEPDLLAGTITLTNGSVDFTGTGTSFQLSGVRRGDEFLQIEGQTQWQAMVDTITSNTAGTLVRPWGGATGTYEYRLRYQPDGSRVTAQARNLIELLGNGRLLAIAGAPEPAGVIEILPGGAAQLVPKSSLVSGADYDVQVANPAARTPYDAQLEGFSVLISNMGDGRAAITSRVTATAGVWSDPAYVTGPEGAPSTVPGVVWRGAYNPATTYAADDGVLYDGSSWRAKITTLGNAPPALPIVENTQWQLLARHGLDGVVQVPGLQAQGRLTLTAGVATPTSDVAGATSVYYVPSGGVYVPIYNGAVFDALSISNGLSLALDSNAGHPNYHAAANNYDLFVIDDGGTLRLASGPAWVQGAVAGSSILRGTGAGSTELEVFLGYPVNKNAMTVRFGSAVGDTVVVAARKATYVGSFRATADGQATDSKAKRLLFNAFNATVRPMKISDPVASWTYNTAAYRQANANANMKLQLLLGLNGIAIEAEYSIVVNNPTANSYAILAIGLDSTTTPSSDCYGGTTFLGIPTRDVGTKYNGFPGLGFHEIIPLENSGATGTTTFYSTGNGYNVGLYGQFLG